MSYWLWLQQSVLSVCTIVSGRTEENVAESVVSDDAHKVFDGRPSLGQDVAPVFLSRAEQLCLDIRSFRFCSKETRTGSAKTDPAGGRGELYLEAMPLLARGIMEKDQRYSPICKSHGSTHARYGATLSVSAAWASDGEKATDAITDRDGALKWRGG